MYPKITLKKGKEISIKRKHHWVFSGAIASMDPAIENGQLVEIVDIKNQFLAIGHFQKGSIMVRILSFKNVEINTSFWHRKLSAAYRLRQNIGLTNNPDTNVYRLVHGEGDQLPGLIIDYYNGTAVIQAHSLGMYRHRMDITGVLTEIYGKELKAVFDKSAESLPKDQKYTQNSFLFGSPDTDIVKEYGNLFEIDWEKGQKTGFFIDQRENRYLLGQYSKGKKVLNAFCYSGGFSIYALQQNAREVYSVDISAKAIDMAERNIHLNHQSHQMHQSRLADVIQSIRELESDFDIIVLDPPAFAKNMHSRHNAVQAYKRLNAEALKQIKTGGVLFTFSCSQVVDKELFTNTVIAAALEVGRDIKILHYLSQPADHPVNIFHRETEYLKGLVLYVE